MMLISAWEGLGCVADHIPFVGNIYGLCDEVVQLCGASYNIGHNCREIVTWAQHMQVSSYIAVMSMHIWLHILITLVSMFNSDRLCLSHVVLT
jgi:hypothetical protein